MTHDQRSGRGIARVAQTSILIGLGAAIATGCGGGLHTSSLNETPANLGLLLPKQARPAGQLVSAPAHLAIARVQGSEYSAESRPSVDLISIRDRESQEDLERLAAMPHVRQISLLSDLHMASGNVTSEDLLAAARTLGADALLVYTLQSTATREDKDISILGPVFLGLLPNQKIEATSSAIGVMLDVSTGFPLMTLEASESKKHFANHWRADSAGEGVERKAQRLALTRLINSLDRQWRGLFGDQ